MGSRNRPGDGDLAARATDDPGDPRATRRRSGRARAGESPAPAGTEKPERSRARVDVTRRAFIVATFGAPGTGKSHDQKALLAKLQPRRSIIVDPDGEYA